MARLATVRFSPGSALLAPNLNLNLMFGSAFAWTWTWKLGSVRPKAEPEHKNSVPKWLKPIKTSDFVKKNYIFHKYFSIVPVYSYIEGLGSGTGWTWTSIKGSGSACARTWTPNLRSGSGSNQVWTVHEPDCGQFNLTRRRTRTLHMTTLACLLCLRVPVVGPWWQLLIVALRLE